MIPTIRFVALLVPTVLLAQNVELGPAPLAEVGAEQPVVKLSRERSVPGNWYDLSNRENVRTLYNTVLVPTTGVATGWTGSVGGCVAGTTTQAFRDAVLARVNYIRGMAGVPMGITFDGNFNTQAQDAALMMSAKNQISHFPDATWPCFTTSGQTAANKSNLCQYSGPFTDSGCVLTYMVDAGANNYGVGHRRWIIYPQTQTMGTGDTATLTNPSNALWIQDANMNGPRPTTRDAFVAWPPAGFVPYQLIPDRWSLSYAGANFTNATVTMTFNGQPVSTTLETIFPPFGGNTFAGENSLVWVTGLGPNNPGADAIVNVTVSNVIINGSPQSFSYTTTIFDPAIAGGNTTPITVTTNPAGLGITVDGVPATSPQTYQWVAGSQHTIATTVSQTANGVRGTFTNWSDAGAVSHSVTAPASPTTYTANFTAQFLLTTTVSPLGSGTISATPTSPDGYYDSGQSVQLQANPISGSTFTSWSGALSGTTNPQSLVMNAARNVTANFNANTNGVTVTTNPPGLQITVDGVTLVSPQSFQWVPNSQHTIATASTQSGEGTRATFLNWSDGGASSHTVTAPLSATTYTANFNAQFQLSAFGVNGSITVSPSSPDGFYTAGATVQLTAVPNSGYILQGFSGDLTASTSPQNLTMSSPRTVTATFVPAQGTNTVTVTTNPPGLTIIVDNITYTAPRNFTWTLNTQHTLSVPSPQNVTTDSRNKFGVWSNAGAQTQTVTTPTGATMYVANFVNQYKLTATSSPANGGGITALPTSADGFYNSGTNVQLTPVSSAGFGFTSWGGGATGQAIPLALSMTSARSVIANFTSVGGACTYVLSQNQFAVASSAGEASLRGSSQAGCNWTASGGASWIRITSGTAFTAVGDVTFSFDSNPGAARSATFTVAGQTVTFTQDAAATPSTAGLRFVNLAPCRLMETRSLYNFEGRTGSFGPPTLTTGETRTLTPSQSNVCQIPATVKAYVFNVTLVPNGTIDFVTIWPAGQARPNYWTARSPDGQIVANSAIVAAGTNGAIQVYASNPVDMIVDITGYFTDNPQTSNLVFYPLTPCRVVDTRALYRTPAGPFGPPSMIGRTPRRFQVPATPYCTIPAGASAYSVTLTVAPPGPLQFLTAWPAGGAQPNVSSINSPVGRVLANSVILPASADGSIDVYAFDNTDFLVDINGYFAPDDGANGLYYFPVTQCRVSNSADANFAGAFGGPIYADETTRTLPIPSSTRCAGIPTNARAYALNTIAVPAGSPMPFLTAFPTGQPRPNASILNAFEGQTVANSAIVPAGTGGSIDVFAYRRTHVAVEISGYFGR